MNRYLVLQRIVELGTFTKAANELGLTQSAVSQSVSSLEEELHIKLLNRPKTVPSLQQKAGFYFLT